MMENKSLLDEIEDYNFAEKQLIYKMKSEIEVRELLQKRGVSESKITEFLVGIRNEFSGIKYFETCRTVRYVGHVIDNIIVLGIIFMLFYLVPITLNLPPIVDLLVFISILLGYYLPLEAGLGWTLGKLITGNRVIDKDFNKPSIIKVVIRTICRIIPFPWWIDRLLHDRLSNTYVVNKRKLDNRVNMPSA